MSLILNHMVSLVLKLRTNVHGIPPWKVNQCAQMLIFVLRTQKNSEGAHLETQDNVTALPAPAASPAEMDAGRDLRIHQFNPLISQRRRLRTWGEGLLFWSHKAGVWPNWIEVNGSTSTLPSEASPQVLFCCFVFICRLIFNIISVSGVQQSG